MQICPTGIVTYLSEGFPYLMLTCIAVDPQDVEKVPLSSSSSRRAPGISGPEPSPED
jgi:hypothetical protein